MVFLGVWIFTIIFEIYTALIYGLLGLIQFSFMEFILFRLVPTALLNLILLVILFAVTRKLIKN